MIEFEDRLRTSLAEEAGRARGAGVTERVLARAARRSALRRRRRHLVGAVASVAVVSILGAGVARVASDPGQPSAVSTGALAVGWSAIPDAPVSARFQHLSVWAGDQLVVWGGYDGKGAFADGASYDPETGLWRRLPAAPGVRRGAIAVWTGDEVVLLGDEGAAAYSPRQDRWRLLPDPPLGSLASAYTYAVWTGGEVLVAGSGGATGEEDPENRWAASYDPEADRWRRLADAPQAMPMFADAFWTGRELLVYGPPEGSGNGPVSDHMVGLAYDPAGDRWRTLPDWPLGPPRFGLVAAWTGTELVVGGGGTSDMAALDPVTGSWRRLPNAPLALGGVERGPDVWTGSEVVALNQGDAGRRVALLDPATGAWRVAEISPVAEQLQTVPVWSGREVLVWGGGREQGEGNGVTSCCTPVGSGAALDPGELRARPVPEGALSAEVPAGWVAVSDELDLPPELGLRSFTAATTQIVPGQASGCQAPAVSFVDMGPNDAVVWVREVRGAGGAVSPRPPVAELLAVAPITAADRRALPCLDEAPEVLYRATTFTENDRTVVVHVALGVRADEATRAEVAAVLDGLRVPPDR